VEWTIKKGRENERMEGKRKEKSTENKESLEGTGQK